MIEGSGFDNRAKKFNVDRARFLAEVAAQLRESLLHSVQQILYSAQLEDLFLKEILKKIDDKNETHSTLTAEEEGAYAVIIQTGYPIFVLVHNPLYEEVRIGNDFVNAISCRLVEGRFVKNASLHVLPKDRWPEGDEMILYMPIKNDDSDTGAQNVNAGESFYRPLNNDVVIKYICSDLNSAGNRTSSIYALGKDYFYEYESTRDVDAEIQAFLQDPHRQADELGLERLELPRLIEFQQKMIRMKLWPSRTIPYDVLKAA